MKISDIYAFLCRKFPTETALDFDNVGLLIGDGETEITSAVVALDCTDTAVDLAVKENCGLIITHHPIIFEPLKSIPTDSIVGRVTRAGIAVISMHTNLDMGEGGVNDRLFEALCLSDKTVFRASDDFLLRMGKIAPMSSGEFAAYVGRQLGTVVKYVGNNTISTVAICSGSGGDYLCDAATAGADALVSADVRHHRFMEAAHKGLTLIDAGHFATEDVVIEPLAGLLKNEFPTVRFLTDHNSPIKVCVN